MQSSELTVWMEQLQAQLQQTRQRQLLSVQGDMRWCDDIAKIARSNAQSWLTITDRQTDLVSTAYSKVETLLGKEAPLVIVDLFGGINPDALCIASGLLTQGGLLVLLSDKLQNWPAIDDQFGVWQDGAVTKNHAFVNYFFAAIKHYANACVFLKQGEALPELIKLQPARATPIIQGKTQEQLAVLSQLNSWLSDDELSVMLIKAQRGRGKSACLGLIAAELMKSLPRIKLIVSAYSKQSAAVLLQQAGDVEFMAPDQLISSNKTADVLIIDEAAMLPLPMLRQLSHHYAKIIMATTTGGYEGTGQGFLLRFLAHLPERRVLSLDINRPVRWTADDVLEPALDAVLLLKPKLQPFDPDALAPALNYRVIKTPHRADMALIKKIYELMAAVHYRTRPSDLRMLMDNPDLSFVLAEAQGRLIGILILNREGGFTPDLCEQIYLGKRRPKGHLLAQMLTAQASVKSFAGYRGLRIQRIAVAPAMQRRGVGRKLIDVASEYALNQGFDYIGACFAFDAENSQFWHSCRLPLVHIGFARGKSTGNHSVAVLKKLTGKLDGLINQMQIRLHKQLPVWLTQHLSAMDAQSVAALLRSSGFTAELNELDQAEIMAFTDGYKGFELCFACLQICVMQAIAHSSADVEIHHWLVDKAVRNRHWDQLVSDGAVIGRKQKQQRLRKLIASLLNA